MRRQPPIEVIVFVVGASSLGAEIAAARLLAPYFGASTIVWANTIATVLVALSIGYWLGGRLADRNPTPRGMCGLVLGAAVLLALVPFAAGPFLRTSVRAFDALSAGAFFGSLFGVLALVAVPVVLLGAVAPYAIRLSVRRVEESGAVAGRLYAISTFGSLIGVFLSALAMIPFLGTRRTFLAFALALAVVGVLGLGRRYALAPLVLIVLIAVPVGSVKGSDGQRVIWERETTYQYARVVEDADGRRDLELNEGQAVHSIYRPETVLTDDVWDGYLVLPFAARREPPRRLAILGNAAGTTARAYERFFPATEIDGVEIDGDLTEAGRELFGMDNPRLRTHTADARPFLAEQDDGRYDAIFVDAYRQPYIPFYLATREFFELARDKLTPGGVVVVNAGHPEGSDDLERVLSATMRDVFHTVLRDPIEETNTLLLGTAGAAGPERLRDAAPRLAPELRPVVTASAARLRPALRGGDVYTDDRAPVEWLIDTSIVEYAAGGGD
ncbi:MAG TPA: fused MFS/spermidine synthase [Solirubrobacteraceae bacterium]|nr:fused MFS/spermidine synthase [Solirubrobacteraceae bacterium]